METSRGFMLNYVLIDFENVHPKNISVLGDEHFQILLFVGAQQSKIDIGIAEAMQQFGPDRAKYIRVMETGKNALDFHITFYLGKLTEQNPKGYFHIISKDKGFDPLIKHLNSRGICVRRHASLTDIPVIGLKKSADMTVKLNAVLANLKARGTSRPRKEDTLKNTLRSMFKETLSEKDVSKLFHKLVESKQISMKDKKITYHLSK